MIQKHKKKKEENEEEKAQLLLDLARPLIESVLFNRTEAADPLRFPSLTKLLISSAFRKMASSLLRFLPFLFIPLT